MGWLFMTNARKADVVRDLTARQESAQWRRETVAYCLRGNVLWTVYEVGDRKERSIVCNLLDKQDGGGWGYKDIAEEMHPFYYSCPLGYLELAPVACAAWRELVRAYHRRGRGLQVGQRVALEHCSIPWVRISSVRPLRGAYQGVLYRIPRRHLGEVLPEISEVNAAG